MPSMARDIFYMNPLFQSVGLANLTGAFPRTYVL